MHVVRVLEADAEQGVQEMSDLLIEGGVHVDEKMD